jgi:hypothetical protein
MDTISTDQMWSRIPPEEKFHLLSQSHASGTSAVLLLGLVCGVLAVGLGEQGIMWLALILLPIVFQQTAAKRWRELKPRTILEYLAVRSAARRFAFAARARDLSVHLIVRGNWTEDGPDESEQIATFETGVSSRAVWLILLGDCLVCLSEGAHGATLEYGAHLRDELEMQSVVGESSKGKQLPLRELRFWKQSSGQGRISCRFTTPYPGALAVFEHLLQQRQREVRTPFSPKT